MMLDAQNARTAPRPRCSAKREMNAAFNACSAPHSHCRTMDVTVRSCLLIIAGERYGPFELEIGTDGEKVGFIKGPVKPLKIARISRGTEIQFAGEPPRAASITHVNDVGMEVLIIDMLAVLIHDNCIRRMFNSR